MKETAASYVVPEIVAEQPAFVAAVESQKTLVQQVQCLHEQRAQPVQEVLLVSSPGFAVLDSGCGKTIVGQKTLSQFQSLWEKDDRFQPTFKDEVNVFKFGNGERETSTQIVIMPIGLDGKFGTVQAAIVAGDAPLLLSRPALKRLGASIDFANDRLSLFDGKTQVQLKSNAAGQYVLDVMNFPARTREHEVQMVDVPSTASNAGLSRESENNQDKHNGGSCDKGIMDKTGNNRGIEFESNPSSAPGPASVSFSSVSRPFSNAQWSPIASESPPDQKPPYECLGTQNIPNSKKQGGLTTPAVNLELDQ